MRFLITSAVCFGLSVSAAGAASLYNDLATFVAATSATAQPPLPDLGNVGIGPTTVGDLTFSKNSNNFFIGTGGAGSFNGDFSSKISGNDIGISGPENLTIASSNALFAFGFFIHEPIVNTGATTDSCNAACEDSTFRLDLYNGGSLVDSAAFDPTLDARVFVGVQSALAFDRIELVDVTGGIDNEFLGEFYTATVPLPAGLPLILAGLGALAAFGRRKP